MTPQSTAREIHRALRQGDNLWALKMTLQGRDHLRELLRGHDEASRAWTAAPRTTGDRRWDALLAALTEHEFEAADLKAPSWPDAHDKRLEEDDAWVLPSLRLMRRRSVRSRRIGRHRTASMRPSVIWSPREPCRVGAQ